MRNRIDKINANIACSTNYNDLFTGRAFINIPVSVRLPACPSFCHTFFSSIISPLDGIFTKDVITLLTDYFTDVICTLQM